MLQMGGYLHEETGLDNLCMAGGVALNCVANGASSARRRSRTSSCSRRRATRAARSASRTTSTTRSQKQPRGAPGPCLSGAGVQRRRDPRLPGRQRRPYDELSRRELLATRRAADRRGERDRLVPGAAWSSGRARSAAAASSPTRATRRSGHAQPEDQVPRELPAVRALGAGGQGAPSGSSSTATARTCCWWRRCGEASARSRR